MGFGGQRIAFGTSSSMGRYENGYCPYRHGYNGDGPMSKSESIRLWKNKRLEGTEACEQSYMSSDISDDCNNTLCEVKLGSNRWTISVIGYSDTFQQIADTLGVEQDAVLQYYVW